MADALCNLLSIFFYLLGKYINPANPGSARINAKERDKKEKQVTKAKKKNGIKVQRMKPPAPTPVIDTFIGDEEQNGKQKKNE